MRPASLSVLALSIGLSTFSPALAGHREGDQALKSGNYSEAIKEFEQLAARGDAKALSKLGQMYASGHGVTTDRKKAAELFLKAAEMGDADGAYCLGAAFGNGEGVPKNREEAAKWLRLAAGRGHARAAYLLGLMLLKGDGLPQVPVEGMAYMNQARRANDMDAGLYQRNLLDAAGDALKLRYEGGFGDSAETAVRIKGPSGSQSSQAAQHKFIELFYPGWQNSKQSLLPRGNKLFSALELTGPKGENETVFFDVTGGYDEDKN